MIALIDCLGNIGRADAVAHLPDKRCTAVHRLRVGAVSALAHGADDSICLEQCLRAVGIFHQQPLRRDGLTGGVQMHLNTLLQLPHQDRPVTDVAVWCQRVPHFHQMDCLPLLIQVHSTLAPGKTAAQNNNTLSNLVLLHVIVIDHHHVVAMNTGQGRHNRRGADSKNEGIRRFPLHIFRCDSSIQPDLYALRFSLPLQRQPQLIHLPLEGNGLLGLQNAAHFPALFA